MTCQEISAIARYHYHPIIIVLNNNGYTTEKGLDEGIKKANTIHSWNYEKLIELVGSGRYIGNIRTEKDLDLALCHCFDMASVMAMTAPTNTSNIKIYSERDSQGNVINTATTTSGYGQPPYDYSNYGNVPQEMEWHQFHQNQMRGQEEVGEKERIDQQGEDRNISSTIGIIDKVYSKEKGGFISYPEYWRSIMKKEKRGYGINEDDHDDLNEKDKREKGKKNRQSTSTSSKLKTNYLTIIEIKLEEMGMSFGSQRFITLSQQKERI